MSDDPNATTYRGDSLPPGVLVTPQGGRYVLGDEIARGGMGAVYRATDTTLDREVAVKVLQERFAPDSGTARRFADEAHIAGQLQHPGIPPIHDFGTLPDGRPFLAMKLIKGDTLDDLLRARRDPGDDRGRFVAVFEAVCQAVGYAHAHDVIHRDLKPANIMVGAFGEVQVMDWGLAKVLRPGGAADGTAADAVATAPNTEVRSLRDSDDDHTQAGSVMGTPAYMPPEQAAGATHKVTPRSDVFGLGAVLAVILTGRPPFEAGSAETTRVKAAQGDVADCLARLDDCGAEPELVALCKRCLSPKPADRPATAGEAAREVAAFRADAEARARQAELDRVKAEGDRATAEAREVEQRKRRRVQAVLATVVVLAVAGVGGVAVWRVDEDRGKRAEAVRLEGEERERKTRAADAVAAVLDTAKAALEAGDADRAAPLLDQADRRAADGAVADHADRLAAYRSDLAMLRTLDAVEVYRWTPLNSEHIIAGKHGNQNSGYPSDQEVAERWRAAFDRFGIVAGTTPLAAAVARVKTSAIQPTLLAVLDGWSLAGDGELAADLRAIVGAADPDPFRSEVRRAAAAGDEAALQALAARAEWSVQPGGIVQAFARFAPIPSEDRKALLARVAAARPTDFGLLMTAGESGGVSFSIPTVTPGAYVPKRYWVTRVTARESVSQSDWREASERVRWYQAAVVARPGSAVAHHHLGDALASASNPAGAAAAYREAVRRDPTFAPPHYGLGVVLRSEGRRDAAVAEFREAVRLDPTHVDARHDLIDELRGMGNLDAAHEAAREGVRRDPTSSDAHLELGHTFHDQKRYGEALSAYREAVRLNPENVIALHCLGVTCRDLHDLDGAVAAYREAVRRSPGEFISHSELGDMLLAKGDLAAAATAFREVLRLRPSEDKTPAKLDDVNRRLGAALMALGDPGGAVAAYRDVVDRNPGDAQAHADLGHAFRAAGRADAAVAACRKVVELDPGRAAPLTALGLALAAGHDFAEAEAILREAVGREPGDTAARVALGDVYRRQGQLAEAEAAYRAALTTDRDHAAAREGLSYLTRLRRGLIAVAPPPRPPTRPSVSRPWRDGDRWDGLRWEYEGGYFEPRGYRNWAEADGQGPERQFDQTEVTPEYVELFDPSRGVRVRLYRTHLTRHDASGKELAPSRPGRWVPVPTEAPPPREVVR